MKHVLATGMTATLAAIAIGNAVPVQALTAGEAIGAIIGAGIAGAIGEAVDDDNDTSGDYDRGYQDGLYRNTYDNRNNSSEYERGFDEGLAASNAQNSSRDDYYSGDYGSDRTLTCYFNGDPQTCTAQVDFSQAGTSVDITFPDGFTRNLVYDGSTFFDNSAAPFEVTVTQDPRYFIVTNENNEYFEIPKGWL